MKKVYRVVCKDGEVLEVSLDSDAVKFVIVLLRKDDGESEKWLFSNASSHSHEGNIHRFLEERFGKSFKRDLDQEILGDFLENGEHSSLGKVLGGGRIRFYDDGRIYLSGKSVQYGKFKGLEKFREELRKEGIEIVDE